VPGNPVRITQRAPNGIRTRAAALKGRCPRPLDDGGSTDLAALPVAPAVGDRPSIGDERHCQQSGRPTSTDRPPRPPLDLSLTHLSTADCTHLPLRRLDDHREAGAAHSLHCARPRWTRRQPQAGPAVNPELAATAYTAGPRRTPLGLRELGPAHARNQARPQPPLLLTNFSAIETGSPSSGTSAQAST
jgi:hypothetical protein